MTKKQLTDAIEECDRFWRKAKRLLKESDAKAKASGFPAQTEEQTSSWASGPQNAEVKRASLDLTRALAAMRRYQ